MRKSSKEPAPPLSTPSILAYLVAVEQWSVVNALLNEDSITRTCNTENMHSLLKDVVNTKGMKFFVEWQDEKDEVASLAIEDAGVASLAIEGAGVKEETPRRCQHNTLNGIAQTKLLDELRALYEEYSFVTAKDASLTDDLRRRQSQETVGDLGLPSSRHTEDSLVYGEIDFCGFCRLLQLLPSPALRQGIFYDIGSGSGRAVFAARFLGDFSTCIGIELLSNLHDMAVSVHSLYKILYRHKLVHQNVELYCRDLVEYDWSDGTVVYAPSLLFDGELMTQIAHKAVHLQPGSNLLSLKKFPTELIAFHAAFSVAQQAVVPMSWGDANVYVYCRNHQDT